MPQILAWKQDKPFYKQPLVLGGGCLWCCVGMPLIGLAGVLATGYNPFGDNFTSEYKTNFDPSVCEDKHGYIKMSETANYYGCYNAEKKPEGEGQLQDETGTLTGDWFDGLVTGKAEYVRPDGKFYEGELVEGKMEGQGILYEEEGQFYYEGRFSNDLFTGDNQEFTDSKGNVYLGSFVNGKKQGWGREIYLENKGSIYNSYIGEFANDKPSGWGVRRTATLSADNDPNKDAENIKGVTFGYNEGSTKYLVESDDRDSKWISSRSPYKGNIFAFHASIIVQMANNKTDYKRLRIYNKEFYFYDAENKRVEREYQEKKKQCAIQEEKYKKWYTWSIEQQQNKDVKEDK